MADIIKPPRPYGRSPVLVADGKSYFKPKDYPVADDTLRYNALNRMVKGGNARINLTGRRRSSNVEFYNPEKANNPLKWGAKNPIAASYEGWKSIIAPGANAYKSSIDPASVGLSSLSSYLPHLRSNAGAGERVIFDMEKREKGLSGPSTAGFKYPMGPLREASGAQLPSGVASGQRPPAQFVRGGVGGGRSSAAVSPGFAGGVNYGASNPAVQAFAKSVGRGPANFPSITPRTTTVGSSLGTSGISHPSQDPMAQAEKALATLQKYNAIGRGISAGFDAPVSTNPNIGSDYAAAKGAIKPKAPVSRGTAAFSGASAPSSGFAGALGSPRAAGAESPPVRRLPGPGSLEAATRVEGGGYPQGFSGVSEGLGYVGQGHRASENIIKGTPLTVTGKGSAPAGAAPFRAAGAASISGRPRSAADTASGGISRPTPLISDRRSAASFGVLGDRTVPKRDASTQLVYKSPKAGNVQADRNPQSFGFGGQDYESAYAAGVAKLRALKGLKGAGADVTPPPSVPDLPPPLPPSTFKSLALRQATHMADQAQKQATASTTGGSRRDSAPARKTSIGARSTATFAPSSVVGGASRSASVRDSMTTGQKAANIRNNPYRSSGGSQREAEAYKRWERENTSRSATSGGVPTSARYRASSRAIGRRKESFEASRR